MSGRRNRNSNMGVVLLAYELFRSNDIPPVTLMTILVQIAIFLGFVPALDINKVGDICLLPTKIIRRNEWIRIISSPFVHGDDLHLYYNMLSFLWKGRRLERKFGSPYFAFLLAVFSILTGIVAVGISFLLGNNYMSQCAVGFSGVIFALKVLSNEYFPYEDTWLFGFLPVPSRYACWLELVVIQILVPNASFVGHLAGILVGVSYTKGPLKYLMDFVYEVVTGLRVSHQQTRTSQATDERSGFGANYRRFFGSGTWGGNSASDTRQSQENYSHLTGGLSEEEQLRRAMDESNRDATSRRYPRSTPSAPPYARLYPEAR